MPGCCGLYCLLQKNKTGREMTSISRNSTSVHGSTALDTGLDCQDGRKHCRQKKSNSIIAFDVGNTMAGFAYSFGSSQSEIYINEKWKNSFGIGTTKTPTILLRKELDEHIFFGYDACYKFKTTRGPEEYSLFHNYKSVCHGRIDILPALGKDDTKKRENSSQTDGVDTTPKEIGTMHIKKFLELILHSLYMYAQNQCPGISDDDARWVITCRFDLSHNRKEMLQTVANELQTRMNIQCANIRLLTEGEAAARWCQEISINPDDRHTKMSPGTMFCIIDCGGASLTITPRKVPETNNINDQEESIAIDFNLDQIYETLFRNLFDVDLRNYLSESGRDLFCMLDQLKVYTHGFKYQASDDCEVPLMKTFIAYLKKKKIHDISKSLKNSKGNYHQYVMYKNGSLFISHKYFRSIFDTLAKDVSYKAEQLFKQLPRKSEAQAEEQFEFLFMIGGASNLLFGPIWRHLQKLHQFKKCHLIIPTDPAVCVMKGAVLYEHDLKRQTVM